MAGFIYTAKARPTTYAGVNFRSRLEATWAAFFDLAGVPWQYEPIDLDGWVPDFVIRSPAHDKDTFIEVKPINELSQLSPGYLDKLANREPGFHIAVCGLSPFHVNANFPGLPPMTFAAVCWLSYQRKDGTRPTRFSPSLDDEWYIREPSITLFRRASNATRWKSPAL